MSRSRRKLTDINKYKKPLEGAKEKEEEQKMPVTATTEELVLPKSGQRKKRTAEQTKALKNLKGALGDLGRGVSLVEEVIKNRHKGCD